MNWHYIFIIIVVFIMFISMGNNPFERPEGYVPPDEFKDGIKAKLEQPKDGFGGLAGGGSQPFTPQFNGFNPGITASGNHENYGSGGFGTFNGAQGYQPHNGFSSAPGGFNNNVQNPSNIQLVPKQAPQPNTNVPAPFQQMPDVGSGSGGGSGASLQQFPGTDHVRTHTGQPVKFIGSSVYTLSKQGRQIAMPDGVYHLSTGRSITVREGHNIFPKDGNEFH